MERKTATLKQTMKPRFRSYLRLLLTLMLLLGAVAQAESRCEDMPCCQTEASTTVSTRVESAPAALCQACEEQGGCQCSLEQKSPAAPPEPFVGLSLNLEFECRELVQLLLPEEPLAPSPERPLWRDYRESFDDSCHLSVQVLPNPPPQ